MTRIKIIAIGKSSVDWVETASAHYVKLLKRFATVETIIVSDRKPAPGLSPAAIRSLELERLSKKLDDSFSIALTDRGTNPDSHEFSQLLQNWREAHGNRIQFVIGGAYGLDESYIDRAGFQLSLSRLTLSHQIARLALLEQLYRGFSILYGNDYHK